MVVVLWWLMTLVSCGGDCPVGIFLQNTWAINYNLKASVSLQDPQELMKPGVIYGKYFCLSDATVIYASTPGVTSQPCFQLMEHQVFKGEARLAKDSTFYEVIDPDQFFRYYHSIPKELNKFLTIRVQSHSSILTGIVKGSGHSGYVEQSFLSPADLWGITGKTIYPSNEPPIDATTFSFYGVLHSFLLTQQDSFIYIYLPLNLGIETTAYKGVLPTPAEYKTEANNYANPAFKLTPSFDQKLAFLSYRGLSNNRCDVYNGLFFHIELAPELLKPALVAYQALVQSYLQNHPGAFSDPYAQP